MAEFRKAKVFDQTYQHYLSMIRRIDYLGRANLLGVEVEDGQLIIPLYDQVYRLSGDAVESRDGSEVTPGIRVILCKYVLTCPAELPVISKRYMTYREFRDAGPLISYFTGNTNKIIESHFVHKLGLLEQRCARLGGVVVENESYDFSSTFSALPRIPLILNFNDADDLFGATCSILYHESAQHYLDMECLAMTGTLLTGKLISQ